MDQFFTTLTECGAKQALEYRAAKGVKVGANQAAEEAQKRLFRGELNQLNEGGLLKGIDELTGKLFQLRSSDNFLVRNISKYTFPFVKTPMNIIKQGIEYSPAGLATIPGAANKTEQLAKVLIGSSVIAASATLLDSDLLTFGEPTSVKQKSAFRAAGRQAYSVKIGDKWYSYSKLHPAVSFNLA